MALNGDGQVEITLSQLIKDELADFDCQAPSGAPKVKRSWDSRTHAVVRREEADLACITRRATNLASVLHQRPNLVPHASNLESQLVAITGNNARPVHGSNRVLVFASEQVAQDLIAVSGGTAAGEVAAGSIIDAVLFIGVLISVAVYAAAKTLETLWKLRADPQPMPMIHTIDKDPEVWIELLDSFCVDRKELSGPIHVTKKKSDLGVESYSDWIFDFSLETKRENSCTTYSCVDFFSQFASCSWNSHTKYKSGEVSLGCGIAKYTSNEPPKAKPEMQNDCCCGGDKFSDHADIHEHWVKRHSADTRTGTALAPIKAGKPDTFISWYMVINDAPYQYNIYWKDCCELAPGQTEMYDSNPLGEKDPGHTKCQEILTDNYKRCNNGGVGGSIEAGCLVYEFKADAID